MKHEASDGDLAAAAQTGDQKAIENLCARFSSYLSGIIAALLAKKG